MGQAVDIISILVASMLKFAFSPLVCYQLGYSFGETVLFTSIGGCLSVFVFYRSAGWLLEKARIRRVRRIIRAEQEGRAQKKTFTRRNRWIVRIKRGPGLKGLIAITPPLISIPIGSVIAAKYFYHDRRTLPLLLSSVVVWSAVLSSLWTIVR